MTVAQSVADVLSSHVKLELECIDRMYLNVYVPQLQYDKGVVSFFRFHRGHTFASSVLSRSARTLWRVWSASPGSETFR